MIDDWYGESERRNMCACDGLGLEKKKNCRKLKIKMENFDKPVNERNNNNNIMSLLDQYTTLSETIDFNLRVVFLQTNKKTYFSC